MISFKGNHSIEAKLKMSESQRQNKSRQKLTELDVVAIKKRLFSEESSAKIALDYLQVKSSVIRKIKAGVIWKHVEV